MRSCSRVIVVAFAAWVAAWGSPAYAQLVDGPIGAAGGIFGGRRPVPPNKASQRLDINFDLSGGYERNPDSLLGTGTPASTSSWFATTASAGVRHRVGSNKRALETRGRGYFNYQSDLADSLIGGETTINVSTQLDGRGTNRLSAVLQGAYEPGWALGPLQSGAPLTGGETTLGVAPPQGIIEQRWLVLGGTASYDRQTRRQSTRLQYDTRRLRPIEGSGFDSDSQMASVDQSWTLNQAFALTGAYRINQTQNEQTVGVPNQPTRYQTGEVGFRYQRRLSVRRTMSFSLRGGATQVFDNLADGGADSVQSSFGGTADLVSRAWSLSASLNRGVSVLGGIIAVPVINDGLVLSLQTSPTRKLKTSVFGSLTRSSTFGTTGGQVMDVAGGSVELRYAIAPWAATFASYGYYRHSVDDPTWVANGFPTQYQRSSVRVGVTLWIPLYGAF
jgi:hypothetical protein